MFLSPLLPPPFCFLHRPARTFYQRGNTENDNGTYKRRQNIVQKTSGAAEDPATYETASDTKQDFNQQ